MTFVDTNILIDIASGNPEWAGWSSKTLSAARGRGALLINAAVYAEFAIGFWAQAECDRELAQFELSFAELSPASAFRAAQAFRLYQRAGGQRLNVLPDFLIGAHASVLGAPLLTRDVRRYRTFFPELALVAPESH